MAVGKLFHIIHMTGQLNELEAWYDDVFAVKVFMPHSYMPGERRDASLVLLGDTVIEPLAPAFSEPDWSQFPLGRFYNRFGDHWHSIAYYADDTVDIWRTAQKLGLRTYGEGGKPLTEEPVWDEQHANTSVFTHPKETLTQIEFFDPRFGDSHHAAAFKVQNLDDTEAYFTGKGIRTAGRDDQTLITDPKTTFGVPFRWTTWDVPGGPRDTK